MPELLTVFKYAGGKGGYVHARDGNEINVVSKVGCCLSQSSRPIIGKQSGRNCGMASDFQVPGQSRAQ